MEEDSARRARKRASAAEGHRASRHQPGLAARSGMSELDKLKAENAKLRQRVDTWAKKFHEQQEELRKAEKSIDVLQVELKLATQKWVLPVRAQQRGADATELPPSAIMSREHRDRLVEAGRRLGRAIAEG